MTEVATKKGILASIMTVISFLYQSFGVLAVVLGLLMVMDYITGFVSAVKRGEQKSRIGIWGIVKKFGQATLVVVAYCFDFLSIYAADQLGATMPISGLFGTIVTCWLISNESLSIVENLGELGAPTPKFIRVALERVRDWFEKRAEEKNENR